MDDLFVVEGIAIIAIILARILERKELLIFAGVMFALSAVPMMIDNKLEYQDSVLTTITVIDATTTEITETPHYKQFEIAGNNATIVVALTALTFGLITGLKGAGQ